MKLTFCSHHQVDHLICEVPVFIQLDGVNLTFNFVVSFILALWLPY